MRDRPTIQTAIIEAPLVPVTQDSSGTPGSSGTPAPVREPSNGSTGGGAVCTFHGITRPETHPDHGPLVELDYEAARPLADRVLQSIATEIAAGHDLISLTIRHAIGAVPVGAASVEIIAVAAHRDAAFTACREAIDRTKSDVPIWKRERWRRGSFWSPNATPLVAAEPAGPRPTTASGASR